MQPYKRAKRDATNWVCLKMLCTPKPNGFADHYPVIKNGYFIGNINPTFSDKPIFSICFAPLILLTLGVY